MEDKEREDDSVEKGMSKLGVKKEALMESRKKKSSTKEMKAEKPGASLSKL